MADQGRSRPAGTDRGPMEVDPGAPTQAGDTVPHVAGPPGTGDLPGGAAGSGGGAGSGAGAGAGETRAIVPPAGADWVTAPEYRPLGPHDPVTIAGYRLAAVLGDGGMGRVYLSRTPGGLRVAVKVVRPEFAGDPAFRRRFALEVATASRVHGPYTAPVIDADPAAELPWLATAYVPGPSLQHAVGRAGPLPALAVLRLVAGVAEALQTIHAAGVVHRDLKPSNVILTADGPRVIDFGIARAGDNTAVTGTGVAPGTPAYMAPEYILGRPVSPATDVFALGVLATFAATGAPAFGTGLGPAVSYRILEQEPDLTGCPAPLHPVIARCLHKDPDARPGTAELIGLCHAALPGISDHIGPGWLADLGDHPPGEVAGGDPGPARPARPASTHDTRPMTGGTPAAGVPEPLRRRRRAVLLAGAAVLLLVAGAVVAYQGGLFGGRGPGRPTASASVVAPPVSAAPPAGPAPQVHCGGKQLITAEGAAAQDPAMGVFTRAYQARCGPSSLSYTPSGTGPGLDRFGAGQVDLATIDSPLDSSAITTTTTRCKGGPAAGLPLVLGPIAIVYRLDGIPGLTLDGETASRIFSGAITSWNDPMIAARNPGVTLPDLPVATVHRSDATATTDVFQEYLFRAGTWTTGAGQTFSGPTGEGASNSSRLAATVSGSNGAIGYLDWSVARTAGLAVARIDDGGGPVALTADSVATAVRAAATSPNGNGVGLDLDAILGSDTKGGYPLLWIGYTVACTGGYDQATATAVKAFLTTAATDGQQGLADAGAVPLPPGLRAAVLDAIGRIAT